MQTGFRFSPAEKEARPATLPVFSFCCSLRPLSCFLSCHSVRQLRAPPFLVRDEVQPDRRQEQRTRGRLLRLLRRSAVDYPMLYRKPQPTEPRSYSGLGSGILCSTSTLITPATGRRFGGESLGKQRNNSFSAWVLVAARRQKKSIHCKT